MVTIRSPCCGYNLARCVELKGEDLSSYSHKIESVNYENVHMITSFTNKAYLSVITVTSIFQSFTYEMAAKTSWHRYRTKLRHCHPMYTDGSHFYSAMNLLPMNENMGVRVTVRSRLNGNNAACSR